MTPPKPLHPDPLSEAERQALVEALHSAWAPEALAPALNELLITRALEDPFAPASDEELAESERLRQALETGSDHPDRELFEALKLSRYPERGHLSSDFQPEGPKAVPRGKGKLLFVSFGASAVLATAAAWLLLVSGVLSPRPSDRTSFGATTPNLSRSSQELFEHKFELGNTTARIDHIASVRQRELRDNRFAQWGVR